MWARCGQNCVDKWSTSLTPLRGDWKNGQNATSYQEGKNPVRLGGSGGNRRGFFLPHSGRFFGRKKAVGEPRSGGTAFFAALDVVHLSTQFCPSPCPHLPLLLSGFCPSACPLVHHHGVKWLLRYVLPAVVLGFASGEKEAQALLATAPVPPFGLVERGGRLRRPPCFSKIHLTFKDCIIIIIKGGFLKLEDACF